MFNPTENSHFRKYLATLGISISLAALAAGGFLFRTQADLLIEQKKINELTPVAREAIGQRQNILLFATKWAPYAVAGVVIVGIGLTIFGLKGWAKRQKSVDKREDMEVDKLAAEIRTLTSEEKEQKVKEEVQEVLDELSDPEDSKQGPQISAPSDPSKQNPPIGNVEISQRPAEIARTLSDMDTIVVDKLQEAFATWTVSPDVLIAINSEELRYHVDALISPPIPGARYVVEWKYVPKRNRLRSALEAAALTSVAAAKALSPDPNPEHCAFPVIIIISENHEPITAAHTDRVLRTLAPALAIRPSVLTFTRDELSAVSPERLRLTIKRGFKLN